MRIVEVRNTAGRPATSSRELKLPPTAAFSTVVAWWGIESVAGVVGFRRGACGVSCDAESGAERSVPTAAFSYVVAWLIWGRMYPARRLGC